MAKPSLIAKLARTVRTKDGDVLRTRGDAASYMTNLPEQRARYQAWQYAAKLMLDGAEAEQLTTQIEYALTLDGNRVGEGKVGFNRRVDNRDIRVRSKPATSTLTCRQSTISPSADPT